MEPKRVQEMLEYATSFEHKGREYFFPELDFPQKLQLMFISSTDKEY